jgi:hypothetical protein
MCFDVNDCATQAEAHTSRKTPQANSLLSRHGPINEYQAVAVIFTSSKEGIKKEPSARPFLHTAKKNHSNFILSVV